MVETETFITVTLHNANAVCRCIMGNVQLQVTSLRAEGIFFCFLEKANVELRPLGETVTLDWSPMRQKQNNIEKNYVVFACATTQLVLCFLISNF